MSKINPLFFALGIPVVVIVILVAIVAPRMGGGGKFAELTPFPSTLTVRIGPRSRETPTDSTAKLSSSLPSSKAADACSP